MQVRLHQKLTLPIAALWGCMAPVGPSAEDDKGEATQQVVCGTTCENEFVSQRTFGVTSCEAFFAPEVPLCQVDASDDPIMEPVHCTDGTERVRVNVAFRYLYLGRDTTRWLAYRACAKQQQTRGGAEQAREELADCQAVRALYERYGYPLRRVQAIESDLRRLSEALGDNKWEKVLGPGPRRFDLQRFHPLSDRYEPGAECAAFDYDPSTI